MGTKRLVLMASAVAALILVSGCTLATPGSATPSPRVDWPTTGPSPSPSEGPPRPTSTRWVATPPETYTRAQPTLERVFAGGHAESGPFTFTLFLYRADRFDPVTWTAPWCYSDIPGVGGYMDWVYHGPSIEGPVELGWGPESELRYGGTLEFVGDGYHMGRAGGGILLPADASPGDTMSWVMMVSTPQGCYGAALRFGLVQGPDGLEPRNISVEALPPHRLDALCQPGVIIH
jgi:hypothetical protein